MHWATSTIDSIKELCIPHRHFHAAAAEMQSRVLSCVPGELIDLIGPSRSGKTRLVRTVMQAIYGKLGKHDKLMSYAFVTASNANTAGAFSTRSFTLSALSALRHPFYEYDLSAGLGESNIARINRTPEATLREALIQALIYRKVKVLIIDEIQNVRFVPGGTERASWFLDSLKCAAFDAGIVLILIGTYEILPILDRCPQLEGRSDQIHIPRYKSDISTDIVAWEQVLASCDPLFRFKTPDGSLRLWNEYLFENSLGCIGLLMKWFRSALSEAVREKAPWITMTHFEKTKRSRRQLRILHEAILQGEYLLQGDFTESEFEPPKVNVTKQARSTPPFRTKPRRHKIGNRNEQSIETYQPV